MIYKYRSFNSEFKFQAFTEGKLYFARPSQFNDPFELKPKIIGLDTLDKREIFVDGFIKKNSSHLNYKKRNEQKRQALIRLSNSEQVEESIHLLLEEYGIFSVSKKWDHILMWSHYSDSHKGFCIGFDFDENFDLEMRLPVTVAYSDKYPEFGPEMLKNDDDLIKSTIGSKSDVWSYEEEIRYIKLAREGGCGLYKFSREKIKEVILGACISDENASDIKGVLKARLPWVKLFQTKISNSKYKLERVEISS